METKVIERYFFFILLFGTLIFSAFIFSPFWIVLVLGIAFSVVLSPIHNRLNNHLPNWLSALLTVLFFIVIVGIPLFSIGTLVFEESKTAYQNLAGNFNSTFLDSINNSINNLLPEGVSFDLYQKVTDFTSSISSNLSNIFTSTLSAIFSLILTLLAMFYFLKDGKHWKKALVILSPLSDTDDEKIIARLNESIHGIMIGYLLVALLQGLLMGIGLAIFGVPNPALWGLVAMFASFVPTIGTTLVSVPVVVFLLLIGQTPQAIGFAIWAATLVGTIDNILNPYIIGSKLKLPPLLMLFAVLGGISVMGPIGILIGPLTISLLYVLLSLYRDEFSKKNAN